MRADEQTIDADDGTPLHLYRWLPAGEPRGVVQIVHGMAEHAKRYARLAESLTAAGWAVYAHDQRGHGKTASHDEDVGHFADHDGFARVVGDARKIRRLARKEHRGPLALLGHSMGSFISLHDVTAQPSVDALALSGSSRGGGALVRAGRMAARLEKLRLGARGKSGLLSSLSFGSFNKPFEPARTKFDWLSRDPDEVDKYVADARCGFECTTQLWIDLTGALIELAERGRLARLPHELPIYVFSGSMDAVSEQTKTLRPLLDDMKAAGLTKVEHCFYEGARHELFNETNRNEVTADFVAWLERSLPAS